MMYDFPFHTARTTTYTIRCTENTNTIALVVHSVDPNAFRIRVTLPINQSRRKIQKRWVRFILSKLLTHSNLETHAVYINASVITT